MEVNFIITAHDKEEFWPWLQRILDSYQVIRPRTVLCYNGEKDNLPFNAKVPNLGHTNGDMDLTLRGYDILGRAGDRWLKIGIDSWLCDEGMLLHIFNQMEERKCGYAGNRWHGEASESLATDIFFADTRYGRVFEKLGRQDDFERRMFLACRDGGIKTLMIPERTPVHPNNRLECAALKWTMHHGLDTNLANLWKWRPELAV